MLDFSGTAPLEILDLVSASQNYHKLGGDLTNTKIGKTVSTGIIEDTLILALHTNSLQHYYHALSMVMTGQVGNFYMYILV